MASDTDNRVVIDDQLRLMASMMDDQVTFALVNGIRGGWLNLLYKKIALVNGIYRNDGG